MQCIVTVIGNKKLQKECTPSQTLRLSRRASRAARGRRYQPARGMGGGDGTGGSGGLGGSFSRQKMKAMRQ